MRLLNSSLVLREGLQDLMKSASRVSNLEDELEWANIFTCFSILPKSVAGFV